MEAEVKNGFKLLLIFKVFLVWYKVEKDSIGSFLIQCFPRFQECIDSTDRNWRVKWLDKVTHSSPPLSISGML